MPARFCPQCGTAAVPKAKFCIDCGAALAGGERGGSGAGAQRWQLTTGGLGVLGFFVVAGLGIWASILSPAPPPPTLGRGPTPPAAATAMAQGDLPRDHPKLQIPVEVKTFIDDLAKKATAAPNDLATWGRLAQVYYRTAQIDPSYYDRAKDAFAHVLERDPRNLDALRGLGSIHFELDEPSKAIAMYERYLAEKPDEPTVRTALGASYVSAGNLEKAIDIFHDVIAKRPDTWPAHYYLGIALDQQGDKDAGLAAMKRARDLASEDSVRAQIDDTIARMGGAPSPPPPSGAGGERTPFQQAVETAFRAHQIMGPRITRFEWSGPGNGRVVVQNFPMAGMPDEVKRKFTTRLADTLRDAAKTNPPGGAVRIDIADAASGDVMATVEPSSGG